MSILFNEVDEWYSINDSSNLTLPDGDWCIGIWTQVQINTGSAYKYLISNNNLGINNSFNFYLAEIVGGGANDKWYWRGVDGDGTNSTPIGSSSAPGGDAVWRLIIVQRRDADNEIQTWFCELNQSATKEATYTPTNFDSVNGGEWNIGRRVDGNANRYYGGYACEFFKGDFSLTQSQIEELGGGLDIASLASRDGLTLDCYLPMCEAEATITDESGNGNNATRNGSPTTASHPINSGTCAVASSVDSIVATTASRTQSRQATLVIKDPLAVSDRVISDDLGGKSSRLSIVRTAFGGYWSLTFEVSGSQSLVEEWIDEGIMRHVELYSPNLELIWEGFVDQVNAQIGSLNIKRGPALEIGNKVLCAYSTVDTSVTPPAMGVRSETSFASNVASQNKYGILELVKSVGGANETTAEQIRDTTIEEVKEPRTEQNDNTGSSSIPTASITCLGYIHLLKKYTYNSTTTGLQNASTKLENILSGDPNSFISTDYSDVSTNTTQVGAWENDYPYAWNLVQGIVALGDSSFNRYTFGLYAGRKARYEAVPTDTKYQRRLLDPQQALELFGSGQRIEPWNSEPAQWVFFTDLLVGKSQPSDRRLDPRYLFIEQGTYTLPWSLSLQGGTVNRLDQQLAQFGLGGSS